MIIQFLKLVYVNNSQSTIYIMMHKLIFYINIDDQRLVSVFLIISLNVYFIIHLRMINQFLKLVYLRK
jgi:hypothetical protein